MSQARARTDRSRAHEMHHLRRQRWVWLNLAAGVWGALLVVLAFTVHDRGSANDPAMIFHSYTLLPQDHCIVQ